MRFGFHISISGGFKNVVKRAKERSCETIQLFSRNPRGWKYTKLDPEDIKTFRSELEGSGIEPVFVHMPYLPNLATGKKELFTNSVLSLKEELRRAEMIGAGYVVIHVGSRVGLDEETALEHVIKGINLALKGVKNRVMILLENTAGMGSEIGYRFEEIRRIIEKVTDPERIGVVLDTAHAYEAGYDLKNELDSVVEEFDRIIGLSRLKLLHLNDSKTKLGSRIDRHWHIGKGEIGKEGFRRIVNHKKLRHLPGIMETPRKNKKEDLMNMRMIRSLVE
ncbi:endonuclease [candidate division WOR-3 bacterium]|uniref:Probable endonuclease 4 n=1 Tax=candidate division WOR-3 bacterium TaxID=2052148 RepID=A0A660SI68_UNCW3|nr:MAG: endonuclease [candidate division WOR-3 bacterium]